jgi:uncharacterized protein YndB with AHSA1/START domain
MSARETVLVSEVIPTSRDRIYSAWLDSRQHSAFTGETADIDPEVGGHISTFSGYASGKNIELEPARRIVQSWRSTEFPAGSPDSRLEVTLEDTSGGTLVTVLHTEIPEGQGDRYREGWVRYYLEPMKRYFSRNLSNGVNHHDQSTIEQMAADALEDDEEDSDEAGKEAGDDPSADSDDSVGGGRSMTTAAEGEEDDADDADNDADEEDAAGDDAGGDDALATAEADDEDDGDEEAPEENTAVSLADEDSTAGSGGEGLEVIEEATLPMAPPVPAKARQSGARPRPRAASARNGRPARGPRVQEALAKLSAAGKSAKKASTKKGAAKKAPAKVKAKAAGKKPAAKVKARAAKPAAKKVVKTAKMAAKMATKKASVSAKGAGKAKAKAKPARGGKSTAKSRKR